MIPALLLAAVINADLLISAGHEGRPASCAHFPQHRCNLGATGERAWTPVVADAATQILREHGVSVARLPADFNGRYRVKAAIFIHFDGSDPPCGSGASVGYPSAADMPAALAWHALYWRYWPFAFEHDNFTQSLHQYYGFRQVDASKGSLVLELGEITCAAQRRWLEPRLRWEGALLAHFLSALIGKGSVADPGRYSPEALPQRP